MSPEAQRIAIAEACGWRTSDCTVCGAPGYVAYNPNGASFWDEASCLRSAALIRVIPDYLTDLNAMHDAENTLVNENLWFMTAKLAEAIKEDSPIAHANAAQRAEAFLRVLGKWEESTP